MSSKSYDVVVIGSGITGLSTAYHLKQAGIDKLLVVSSKQTKAVSEKSASLICGGMFDNYTRIVNAHGLMRAKEIWQFGNQSFLDLLEFAKHKNIEVSRNKRLRLIVNDSELKEAKIAVTQLQDAGFSTQLSKAQDYKILEGLSERVLAVQDDGLMAAMIETPDLLTQLSLGVEQKVQHIDSFTKDRSKLRIHFQDGSSVSTEFLVLACHNHISNFLPELQEALVSYADQWMDLSCDKIEKENVGVVFSAHHSYEWGGFGPQSIHFGGARYLRKLAGIGAKKADKDPKIDTYLLEQLKKTFVQGHCVKHRKTYPCLDIWPCDELPVIGPMFGESRVLLATGYMNSGLVWGFQAGNILAKYILHGQCSQLPDILLPKRYRSDV